MTKKELRIQALSQRKNMILNTNICKEFKNVGKDLFPQNGVVAFYFPLNNEPDINCLIQEAFSQNLTVLFPKTIDHTTIDMCPVNNMEEMVLGKFNIFEPVTEKFNARIDLVFVPGVLFGRDGSRLGYGAGYYDRFLSEHECLKIGVAYDQFLIDTIPMDEHDIYMDGILTEKNIFFTNN